MIPPDTGYVAVIGENVADAVVEPAAKNDTALRLRVFPGGGPANTAVALGRLGTPTRFLGRLPHGAFGDLFVERLQKSAVDLSFAVTASEPATLTIASVADDGQASYAFYAAGTADWQWNAQELAPSHFDGVACVHAGSLALVMEPGGNLVEKLLDTVRERATVSIDPNVRAALVSPQRYRSRIAEWSRLADIIRMSEDDAAELFPGVSPDDLLVAPSLADVPLVIITRGERGVIASFRQDVVEIPAVAVRTVDTIGAGDAFSAGILHWLHRAGHLGGRIDHLDIETVRRALAFGARVAALTCAAPGADPPWASQLTNETTNLLP